MEDHARIELLQKLGSGTYGDVWVARHFETADSPTYVAVKLEKTVEQDGGIQHEFSALKTIGKHKHIIEYKEFGSRAERIQNIDGG